MCTRLCGCIGFELITQRSHSHILMTGGGGGVGLSDFLGSEILAQSDFLGFVKDAGIFLGREKKQREKKTKGFFWVC